LIEELFDWSNYKISVRLGETKHVLNKFDKLWSIKLRLKEKLQKKSKEGRVQFFILPPLQIRRERERERERESKNKEELEERESVWSKPKQGELFFSFLFSFFFEQKIWVFHWSKITSINVLHRKASLQNHNHMLWGYKVIDTNKILTIKCYLWLSSSTNSYTKIVKEYICSEQTRSKTRVAKYPRKIYLNWPWEITPHTELFRPWGITHHSWLTFIP
jgi:hypothetical protein